MAESEGPRDPFPMSSLTVGAVQLHECYSTYLRAGFDPGQALYLTGILLTASIQINQANKGNET